MPDALRLVLPAPVGDRSVFELEPGVTLQASSPIPLPSDHEAWHHRVIGDAAVLAVQRSTADAGWPMTIIRAREHAGEPRYALHAFVELFDRGVVVTVSARGGAHFDAIADRVHAILRGADIDRHARDVVALSQLWEEP